METDQYLPYPVRRVEIDKPDGSKRQLGIPTVTDRIIQQAIAQVLTPIFDPDFSNNSFGFTFKGKRIQWHPKTQEKFKQRVRRLTNRNWGVSMRYQLFKISQYLRGWINYFGIANCYQRCVDLDQWIRRRVRMAYWRQWRKPRTKVRNLMKLGVRVQAAVACGVTARGHGIALKLQGLIRPCPWTT